MANVGGAAHPCDVDLVLRQQLADLGVTPALDEPDVPAKPLLQMRLPLRQELALVLQDDRGDAEFQRCAGGWPGA